MKNRDRFTVTALIFCIFLTVGCENEMIVPTSNVWSLSQNVFIVNSKNFVERFNEVYRKSNFVSRGKGDLALFSERWGIPNYSELIQIKTSEKVDLWVVPLQYKETHEIHNLLVGWSKGDSFAFRVIHDNKILTEKTFGNTPINMSFAGIFDYYNSRDDNSELAKDFPVGCYEPIHCPSGCIECIICVKECGGIGGGGGNDTSGGGPHGGSNGGGGSSNGGSNGGETTDPDCYYDGGHVPPDNPDCSNTCMGYYDFDCNGELDDYEICVQMGQATQNCEFAFQFNIPISQVLFLENLGMLDVAAQNQDLLELLIGNIGTPENIALIEDSGGLLVSRTCKSSFDYVPIGIGFTCQVNTIKHSYATGSASIIAYHIPELCIQVAGNDVFGNPLTPIKSAELSAYAMDNARLALFDKINNGIIYSGLQAKTEFKEIYRQELLNLTGGQTTSSISYGACFSNVPTTNYHLNPLGGNTVCIPLW